MKEKHILYIHLLILIVILLVPADISQAKIIIVDLKEQQLTNALLTDVRSEGVYILEPLTQPYYLAWINNSKDNSIRSKFENINVSEQVFSPLFPIVNGNWPQTLNGRYCFWFLECITSSDGGKILENLGCKIIHQSEIIMSNYSRYSIYGALLESVDLNDLKKIDTLRCLYAESGIPVIEDELSVLQVVDGLEEPNISLSLTDNLKILGINGSRTKIGIIDTGCDLNQNEGNHPDLALQISNFLSYPGSPGFDYIGHGTHMAGIIAGNGHGRIYAPEGYNLGKGFAPETSLTISNALIASPFPPSAGFQGMITDIALSGAHICNNSWNDGEGSGIGYHPNCAIWDAAVRNAEPSGKYASYWPMNIIFSSGNQGPQPMTITSPKEAKNIVTVGATGSIYQGNQYRPIDVSSRGPCQDGRNSPLLAAPGEFIMSCWPRDDYKKLTGTSSAAAHVTGAVCLIREWWFERTNRYPSPALMKAILTLSTKPVTENLPDAALGWGCIEIPAYQPLYPAASCFDQQFVLNENGQEWRSEIFPVNPDEPVDIVLCWTDPPGSPGANPALINDLDLILITSGTRYYGNHFSGQFSISGNSPDFINNLERIRIRNLTESAVIVIKASQIRGDGLPSNDFPADQDFSIAVKNGYLVSSSTNIHLSKTRVASSDHVDILVTSLEHSILDSIDIHVSSLAEPEGIILSCNAASPESGVFAGRMFTGTRNRPDEISTNTCDILTFQTFSRRASTYLLVDAIKPEFEEISFSQITANSTDLRIRCNDICEVDLHYRNKNSDPWQTISSELLTNSHKISLQNLKPLTTYEAYVTAIDRANNTQDSRVHLNNLRWETCSSHIVYSENMDEDPEFKELNGQWEWGIPQGNGNPPDPTSGNTELNVLGYNLYGNYENHLGQMDAVSKEINCQKPGNYFFSYYRWLCTESGVLDQATISIKDVNNNWEKIWENPYFDFSEQQWTFQQFDVTSHASSNHHFQFKFTQGFTDGAFSRSGWNIDDIIMEYQEYSGPTPTPLKPNQNPSIRFDFNSRVFFPGDRCFLVSQISIDSPTNNLCLAISAELENGSLVYFPGWGTSVDWIMIEHPEAGEKPVLITDFIVSDGIIEPLTIHLQGYLFDMNHSSRFSKTERVPIRFNPCKHQQ
ncbi:S8 family serine peptidase [bacterium]|nr:S8 family serine peptidase [bacterium]